MSSVASPEGLIHLGMDTSNNAIVVATLLPGEESPVTDRVFNEEEAIRRLIGRFPDRSVLRAWYEAGPGAYDLYRLLTSTGVACQVASPAEEAVRDLARARAVVLDDRSGPGSGRPRC